MTAPYPYPPHQQHPQPYGPPAPQPQGWQPMPQGWQPAPQPWPYQPATPQRAWYTQTWAIALIALCVLTALGGAVLVGSSSDGSTGGRTTTAGGPLGGAGPVSGGDTREGSTGDTGKGSTGDAPGGNCPGGSMEGCYTEAQMQVFLNQAVTIVHKFSDASFSNMPHPAGYTLIPGGSGARSACGTLDATAYAYCPADDTIYIGQSQLWAFYSKLGDAAAVVGLAHEYGHHVQTVAGVPNERTSRGQIAHENQADCIAGAFVGYAEQQGMLEDDDVQDINGLLSAIASSEDDPGRDHGTLEERRNALSVGIRQGLRGCDAFFPDTPITAGR